MGNGERCGPSFDVDRFVYEWFVCCGGLIVLDRPLISIFFKPSAIWFDISGFILRFQSVLHLRNPRTRSIENIFLGTSRIPIRLRSYELWGSRRLIVVHARHERRTHVVLVLWVVGHLERHTVS